MGRTKEKEAKSLLGSSSAVQNQGTYIVRKIHKGRTVKTRLSSVSEVAGEGNGNKEKSKQKCLAEGEDSSEYSKLMGSDNETKPRSQMFGVKSYLHQFYEAVSTPSGNGQEEEYRSFFHSKRRKCGALWFKIGLIVGATLFLLGAVAIVIGYAIPKQKVVLGRSGDLEVVDNEAHRFNENLDRCKLIGLAGFCSGGLILVISLLAPTFTSTYWEEDPAIEPFRMTLGGNILTESEPKSPIPVTEKVKCIQPVWTE